jgi:replicative DNA helicase
MSDEKEANLSDKKKTNPWARHLDAVGDELMRLGVACDVQLRDPGVVDRILQNDETVCGKRNPIGFRKLRDLVKATFDSISKASDRIGPKETKEIIDAITERLDRRRELGGTGGAKRPAAKNDKPK